MSEVLWRRLTYLLTPQADIYQHLAPHLVGKNVLEIGFGTGFGVLQYAPQAQSVVAIEVDKSAVEWARRNIPLLNITWMQDDGCHFSIPQRFDAAVMFEVLEHIKDWRKAISNVADHLGSEGVLYLSARNANSELRKNDLHEREWSASELANAMLEFFESVDLYDYTLSKKQDMSTRSTPLIAVARKGIVPQKFSWRWQDIGFYGGKNAT